MAKHRSRSNRSQPRSQKSLTIQLPLPLLGVLLDTREAFQELCIRTGQEVLLGMMEEEGVESGRGRNPTLRAGQRFLGHRYSPVSRIWAHPRGEVCARRWGSTGIPARFRCRTASPKRTVFQ